jgi:hypothetical protein
MLIVLNKQIDGSLVTIQYKHLTNMHSIKIQCCFQFKQISDFIINRAYKLARKIDDTGRFVFCLMFCISLLVILSYLFLPLYCLSFFQLRFLITPSGTFQVFWANITKAVYTQLETSSIWRSISTNRIEQHESH